MILQQTDEYSFVSGDGGRETLNGSLLRNNHKERYEVWLSCEPGLGSMIWCRWKKSRWLVFDHIASEAEVAEYHSF